MKEIQPILLIGLVFGLFVLGLLFRAFRDRLRRGTFLERRFTGHRAIETYYGTFIFDTPARTLRIKTRKGDLYYLPYDDIVCLNSERGWKHAGLSEFLFEDFGLFDLSKEYRDRVNSYSIFIKTRTGTVPFFTVLQYEVRDFLDFMTPVIHRILKSFHFWQEAQEYANQVCERANRIFSEEGIRLMPITQWRGGFGG